MVLDMDGEIVNPGDLRGRVLPADHVELAWDGDLICALVCPDLVVGASGFGNTVYDALRDLAENLIRDAVWVEIPVTHLIDFAEVRPNMADTVQTNVVELYRTKDDHSCAILGPDDSDMGVFGIGDSVQEALRALADNLVEAGVWIEVTAEKQWVVFGDCSVAGEQEGPVADAQPAAGSPPMI